jgi:hypothetical protein
MTAAEDFIRREVSPVAGSFTDSGSMLGMIE